MSRPLWDRGQPIDEVVLRFTTGRDPELDIRLVPYDALASAAHATMLCRIGILSDSELRGLVSELAAIAADAQAGRFVITQSDEDGHTAIENRLTEKLGEAGQRIHTGRSRNDQVIAALRLYGREAVLELTSRVCDVAGALTDLAEQYKEVVVPGYTHTRQGMPSTLGFLFGAHAETLMDAIPWHQTAFAHLNRSPLGSASGYGVPLPLDRGLVAELLRFDTVQLNTLGVQNDRGKTEFLTLGAALGPVQDLGRLAADLIWFSSDELGYVKLSTDVTTGSSIMPNKRNPDVLELIRANAARLRGRYMEIASVASSHLPSGYHRDLQLTKEPFLEGMQTCLDVCTVMGRVLEGLAVDAQACRKALVPTAAATDVLYSRVAAGEPFRSVYRLVAAAPEAAVAAAGDPGEFWRGRTHAGAPGALDLAPCRDVIGKARRWIATRRAALDEAWGVLVS
jgi:argininosuccinate lyase